MANVLIIKNANFATNRVAVVTFDGKPCTGIELEQSTINVTGDTPVTVAYTVTPADTTDSVIWTSSDTSVATIDGNVVTILGIGGTTITATCGSFSDSLTLTADLYAAPDWHGAVNGTKIVTDSSDNSIPNIQSRDTSPYWGLLAVQNMANSDFEIPLYDSTSSGALQDVVPMRIPNNTKRINISGSSGLYNNASGIKVVFTSGKESVTYANVVTSCKGISEESVQTASNSVNSTISVPVGADSFVLSARLTSSAGQAGTPSSIASTTCGLQIHFLPALTE